MISLWTPNPKAVGRLRKLFRLNLFEIAAPDENDLVDILSVMAPIEGKADRMSVFGISTHLSEILRPLINGLYDRPSAENLVNLPNAPISYESAYLWLSKQPENQRLIARPDFMKSHHGLICLGGLSLAERLALALHKRIGRPAFVVSAMPFKNSHNLDYRFSPGLPNIRRMMGSDIENLSDANTHSEPDKTPSSAGLILDISDIYHLRAVLGQTYLHKLRNFLSKLSAEGQTDLHVVWQSSANSSNDLERTAFEAFITEVAPNLHSSWASKDSSVFLSSTSVIFTLSNFSGLRAAQKLKRLIYTLQDGPLDGLGATQLWNGEDVSHLMSSKLTPAQVKAQNQSIKRIKTQYAFDNTFKSRGKFKSIIQEVILNGVPKL